MRTPTILALTLALAVAQAAVLSACGGDDTGSADSAVDSAVTDATADTARPDATLDSGSPGIDSGTDAAADAATDARMSADVIVPPDGDVYYAAPLSSSCNPATPGSGTLADPYASVYYAATRGGLTCGDTLVLRAGTYRYSYGGFTPDGTEEERISGCDDDRNADGYDGDHTVLPLFFDCPPERPIIIQNYAGEEVILDGSDADLADGSSWTRCESASQCGDATGLSLTDYTETYYATSFNVSNADTPQMWIDPTDTSPGTRIGWWANSGGVQASDSAADHDQLTRGRFFSVGSGQPLVARMPDGSNPSGHSVHLTCQIGDCAAAVIAVTEDAANVVVRRNPAGGAFRLRYGYHVIRIDGDARNLLFDGLDVMGGGGRDYGGCLRTNAGSGIRFINGSCRETMGEGIAFYGGGPTNGRQISDMVLENSIVEDTGRGWIDGGGLGSSLGMSVILKNCDDCIVRGNRLSSTFRDGVWVTTSTGGCGGGCTSNGTIVDANVIRDNCRWAVTYEAPYPPPLAGIGDCAAVQFETQGAGSIRGATITNNMIRGGYTDAVVRNASPMGVLIDSTTEDVVIAHNSVRDTGGACVNLRPSSAPAAVFNNAFDGCSAGSGGRCNGFPCALMAQPSTAHTHGNNTYWAESAATQVVYLPGGRGYTRDEVVGDYEATAVQRDPMFVSATDLHLQAGSMLIDAAGSAHVPGRDLDGDPRPMGSAADIGADEVR